MTGINTPESRNRRDDTAQIRYEKMISVASRFSIIQFGLCLFHDDGKGGFTATPYTFYLFPDSGNDIILSASAISFLRNNNMDFGKWMSSGITFVGEEGEAWLTNKYFPKVDATVDAGPPTQIVLTKQADVDFMTRNVAGLNEMLLSSDRSEYVFEKSNAFLRRAVYQYLETNHADNIVAITNGEQRIVATKCDAEAMKAAKEKILVERKNKLTRELGFRLIFNALVDAKKPMIGHNCLFDLLFLFRAVHGPLPPTFHDFRSLLTTKFPFVFDTKYIYDAGFAGPPVDTALGDLFQSLQNSAQIAADVHNDSMVSTNTISISFSPGFDAYETSKQLHDAGYDAYCTGYVFARALTCIGGLNGALTCCANKLFMMQSLYHLDLLTTAPTGVLKLRGKLYRLFDFPELTSTDAILQVFTAAGYSVGELEVLWIDGVSTYIHIDSITNSDSLAERVISVPEGWRLCEVVAVDDLPSQDSQTMAVDDEQQECPLKKLKV